MQLSVRLYGYIIVLVNNRSISCGFPVIIQFIFGYTIITIKLQETFLSSASPSLKHLAGYSGLGVCGVYPHSHNLYIYPHKIMS